MLWFGASISQLHVKWPKCLKLLQEAVETQTKVAILEEQNTQYKAQLSVYSERFEEFQQTLSKSNEVFNSFKSEMDKVIFHCMEFWS